MGSVRPAAEALIRLFKREIHDSAVLVSADDVFEVTRTPSVILQGPMIKENGSRRTLARFIKKDVPNLAFEECKAPRLYHLDFGVVVTTDNEADLLEFQEKIARLYQTNPVIVVGAEGSLNLTELTPVGGLRRVNLSNLRQASGLNRGRDAFLAAFLSSEHIPLTVYQLASRSASANAPPPKPNVAQREELPQRR